MPEFDSRSPDREFQTTHWSAVLVAGAESSERSRQALEALCRVYWTPLHAYVRRLGYSEHDAEDLTQDFFVRLLAKNYLGLADPARGRFRTFLLTSLRHFLVNEWNRRRALRRGGGAEMHPSLEEDGTGEAADQAGSELVYDRQWAATLIERALANLSREYAADGQAVLFTRLQSFIGAGAEAPPSYPALAVEFNMSEGAVRVAVHRLRDRYRKLLRAEVADTVASPADVEDELRHLATVMRAS